MDAISLLDSVTTESINAFRSHKRDLMEALAGGTQTHEEYKFLCGQLAGLTEAEAFLTEISNKYYLRLGGFNEREDG